MSRQCLELIAGPRSQAFQKYALSPLAPACASRLGERGESLELFGFQEGLRISPQGNRPTQHFDWGWDLARPTAGTLNKECRHTDWDP